MATKFDPTILGRIDSPLPTRQDEAAAFRETVSRQSSQGNQATKPATGNTGVFLPPGQFVAPSANNPVPNLVPTQQPPMVSQLAAVNQGSIPVGVPYNKGYQVFVGTAGRSGGAYDTMARELEETNSTIV